MKLTERSGFQGLMTNVAESKAPPGALVEAQNIVIRRPACIEPRDGTLVHSGLDGTELLAFSFAEKDYIARSVASAIEYRELGAASPLGNSPQPFRRDILSRAEARGNLYVPSDVGVRRLPKDGLAFERTGLPMASQMHPGSVVLIDGPPPIPNSLGLTGFAPASYLALPNAQGVLPGPTFWIAAQVFLHRMPTGTEMIIGRFSPGAVEGYQLQFEAGMIQAAWVHTSAICFASHTFTEEDVGRAHLIVLAYGGDFGVGTLYVDGVARQSQTQPPPVPGASDETRVGNWSSGTSRALTCATLVAMAGGNSQPTHPRMEELYALTTAADTLTIPATLPATHYWLFSAIPPIIGAGGQSLTLTGTTPAFRTDPILWPEDIAPEDYPPEFWLPYGYHVQYRLVAYHKDANGFIRRSPPSAAMDVWYGGTATGAAGKVQFDVFSFPSFTPLNYDTVEIYRSRVYPVGTTIDDEMQLVGTIPAPPPAVTFLDEVPQEKRGHTLYTSPSQGGILQQNDAPPACAVVALFKGSLFFANTRAPAIQKISFNLRPESLAGKAAGIGQRWIDGAIGTAGSPVFTLPNTIGIEPGQDAYGFSTFGVSGTVIDVTPTTVTLDVPAVTGGTGSLIFDDVIWFGDTPIKPGEIWNVPFAYSSANPVSLLQVVPAQDAKDYTVAFIADSRAPVAAPLTLRATHGAEYVPPLPGYNETPKLWDQEVDPGKLVWSKTDEPEHVPPLYYAYVGERRKAILGLVPTRDALYVLKEDGIWRLTGANAAWRIDPFDPTTFCVLPNSVKPLFGRGAFLSRKGVVCVGDAGVELVSGPVHDLWRPVVDGILTRFAATGLYELQDCIGSCAAVFERENEYTIMRGKGVPALVFNQNTGAWSTWDYARAASEPQLQLSALNSLGRTDRVVYSLSTKGVIIALSDHVPLAAMINPTYRADREVTVNVASVHPTTKLITLAADQGPIAVGDILVDAAQFLFVVTAVTSNTQFLATSAAQGVLPLEPVTGAGFMYRSLRCRVVPAGFMEPASMQKHYRAIITAFPVMVGGANVRLGYQSSMDAAWVYEDARVYAPKGYVNMPMGYHNSALVPRAHARAWNLHSAIEWSHAFGNARLEAIFAESQEILPDSPSENIP